MPSPHFTDDRTESRRGLLFAGRLPSRAGIRRQGLPEAVPFCSLLLFSVSSPVRQAGNHTHPLGVYFKISKLLFAYKHQICRRCNAQLRLAAHGGADCTRPGGTPPGSHAPAVKTALSVAAARASESPLLKF